MEVCIKQLPDFQQHTNYANNAVGKTRNSSNDCTCTYTHMLLYYYTFCVYNIVYTHTGSWSRKLLATYIIRFSHRHSNITPHGELSLVMAACSYNSERKQLWTTSFHYLVNNESIRVPNAQQKCHIHVARYFVRSKIKNKTHFLDVTSSLKMSHSQVTDFIIVLELPWDIKCAPYRASGHAK